MPNEYEIAAWRHQQIAPLLDPELDRAARRRAIRDRTRHAVDWPNGKKKRIARSTLHRWLDAFRKDGYLGLLPRSRSDVDQPRHQSDEWIDYAIGLLYEQHERSLTQLEVYLKLQFPDYELSRSTLHRHLHKHRAYSGIERLRRGSDKRLRGRFEASRAHESWQLDGKGPFEVRVRGQGRIRVHVLSVLDDYSRAILAARVSAAESTDAAIAVFQMAVERWGLPERMQFDRGSAFDSHDFRKGLAQCGAHRFPVLVMNPQAQGKIEAYHRVLIRWFINELRVQEVCDLEHFQELLEAMLALVYHKHRHKDIGCSPEERLADRRSDRTISHHDLQHAFYVEYTARSEKKTGVVQLPNGRFQVPVAYAGKSCLFRYDRLRSHAVLITKDRRQLTLEPFQTKPLPPVRQHQPRGQGQLQKLVDSWRGRERPNAEPGFGLPEVFAALKAITGRSVPASDQEAKVVLDFWNRFGPIQRNPFLKACECTGQDLGPNRPIAAYLNHLERQIAQSNKENSDP